MSATTVSALSTSSSESARARAGWMVAAAALLWSTSGVFVKVIGLGAAAVVCGRSAVAALCFLVVTRASLSRLRLARWSTALVYAGTVITFIVATKLTTAANAVFLQYSGSAYVLFLGPWLLGERVRGRDVVCAAISLVGVGLVLLGGGERGHWRGDVVGALSGIFFAFTVVFVRRDARSTSSKDCAVPSIALGNTVATVLSAPFALRDLARARAMEWVALVYLGVVGIAVAYVLFSRGLRHTRASQASVIASLEPALNPLWVCLATNERPSLFALVGGSVVVGAVVLARDASSPNSKRASAIA